MRSPRTAMKSSPCSPQLEKASAQQLRPNTAKKLKNNKKNPYGHQPTRTVRQSSVANRVRECLKQPAKRETDSWVLLLALFTGFLEDAIKETPKIETWIFLGRIKYRQRQARRRPEGTLSMKRVRWH